MEFSAVSVVILAGSIALKNSGWHILIPRWESGLIQRNSGRQSFRLYRNRCGTGIAFDYDIYRSKYRWTGRCRSGGICLYGGNWSKQLKKRFIRFLTAAGRIFCETVKGTGYGR